MDTVTFEQGGRFYIVGPVTPHTPRADEIEAYAYADDVRKMAPSENILWLHGQYVQADKPNANGHLWTQDELCIASVTPMFMPITVMHDPRTAVGLIADTKLLTPEKDDVPLARIDSALAIWQHRFPEVAEEALANYEAGTLMQSMECLPQHYDCVDCGRRFPWMGMSYEDPNWCEHFRDASAATNRNSIRRLGNVTFTGSGLIFGTRGARGALDTAHLDVLAAEVAEFHTKAKQDSVQTPKPSRRKNFMELDDKRYEELVAAEAEAKRLAPLAERVTELEATAAKVPELEQKIVDAEAETAKEKKAREDAEKKVSDAEAKEREDVLATERFSKLGTGFKGKLGEFTREKLKKAAATASDEEWDSEIKVIEEATGVARDEGGTEDPEKKDEKDGTFDKDAVASTRLGGGNGNGGGGGSASPSREAVGSVVRGLMPTKSK